MSETGRKILEGLRDALDGNYCRIEQGDKAFIRVRSTVRQAGNWQAWAIGSLNKRGQFHVRRIVWGRLMARSEKGEGEIVRRATILVDARPV